MKDKNSKYLHNSRVQFTKLMRGFPLYRGVNYIARKTQLTFVRTDYSKNSARAS